MLLDMADGARTSGCKPTAELLLTLISPSTSLILNFYQFLWILREECYVRILEGRITGSRNELRRTRIVLTM